VPFVELFRPGQPVPYNIFPYAAVAILLLAVLVARLMPERSSAPSAITRASDGQTR
jgi:hypothetical protein